MKRLFQKRLVVLATAVAFLGLLDGVLFLAQRKTEAARTRDAGPLASFDPAGVAKVTLTRAGRPPLVLARTKDGSFVVATARNYPARARKVDDSLKRILSWKRERVAGDAKSHEKLNVTRETGLTIKIEDFAGSVLSELIMGSLTGLDTEAPRARGGQVDPGALGRFWRRADEDEVFVVQDFITGELEPDIAEWLDRPLVAGDEAKLRIVKIERPRGGESATLIIEGFPHFQERNEMKPADADKVKAFVRSLLSLSPVDVVAEDDTKVGLSPGRLSVELLWSDGNAPTKLVLGDDVAPSSSHGQTACAARIAGKPSVLVSGYAVAQVLSASIESLALQKVLGEKTATTISGATWREGVRSIAIARGNGGGWTVASVHSGLSAAPRALDDDSKRVRLFQAAVSLPISASDRSAYAHGLAGLGSGQLTVETGRETVNLVFGQQDGNVVWVRRSDIPMALAVPVGAVAELRAAAAALD